MGKRSAVRLSLVVCLVTGSALAAENPVPRSGQLAPTASSRPAEANEPTWTFARGLDGPVEVALVDPTASADATTDSFVVTLLNRSMYNVEHVELIARIFRRDGRPAGFVAFAGEDSTMMAPGDTAEVKVRCKKGLVAPGRNVVMTAGQVRYRDKGATWTWRIPVDKVPQLDPAGQRVPAGIVERAGSTTGRPF